MLERKFFGTDGIRGVANSPSMNVEIAVALGRAVGYAVKGSEELPQVVVGKDTRLSGYMLENAIVSGITSVGINVMRTGPIPTPGVAFICRSMRARAGIMISASHNPSEENGIKVFDESGFKLETKAELELEKIIVEGIAEANLASPRNIGKVTQVDDAGGRYIQYLKETFPHQFNLKGIKIALDAANGAAYAIAPAVLTELGANVTTIGDAPDGHNINMNCGALAPEKVCQLTRSVGANIGVTLDGDADRVLLSDENGNLVDGDAILYICAKHLHARGHLGQATVVGTIVTNSGLEDALRSEGISLVRTDVGDQHVISHMRKNQINLGGETCGHLIYLHHSSTGDGILAALRVLSIMQQTGKPLSALAATYTPYPHKTINIRVREKTPFDSIKDIVEAKRSVDNALKGHGRSLLRYSGTEMIARVTIESDDTSLTEKSVDALAMVVKKCLGV